MTRRAAIVAAVQTKYAADRQDVSYEELVWEVVEKVTQSVGLTWADRVQSGHAIQPSSALSASWGPIPCRR